MEAFPVDLPGEGLKEVDGLVAERESEGVVGWGACLNLRPGELEELNTCTSSSDSGTMTTSEVVAGTLSLSSTPRETGGPPGLRITGESGSDEEECQHDRGGNPREYFGEGPSF